MKSSLSHKSILTCLICGHEGPHDIIVTNFSNYLNSSRTSLANFLYKVIGEEPCYSLSQVVCKQCFLLLDRLDTYQSRSAEITEYITSRYQETKLDFIGNRQRISELIVSSLSNLKSFKNGTTLNVCDELSVTLFRENFPNIQLTPSVEKSLKRKPNNIEDINNENCDKKIRKRNTSGKNTGVKKIKSFQNNNNSDLTTDIHGLSSNSLLSHLQSCFNNAESFKFESGFSDSEESSNFDASNTSNKYNASKNASDSSISNDDNNNNHINSSSNPTTDDSSSENSEEDILNYNKISDADQEAEKTFQESIKSNRERLENLATHTTSAEEPINIEPNLAEAVLVQSSIASNLLQSFISTSLWMNPSEPSNETGFSSLTKQQQQRHIQAMQKQNGECDEDLTVESLGNAVSSINDKKRRLELKNTGQSYINTKGKLIEAKRVWPQDCSRCHLKCNGRLSEELRLKVFAEYWGLGDYDRQREYLATHMEREERIGPSGLSRTVILYYLTLKSKKYQVCRQFFLKTLDVSEKASRIVLEKKLKGELGVETSR